MWIVASQTFSYSACWFVADEGRIQNFSKTLLRRVLSSTDLLVRSSIVLHSLYLVVDDVVGCPLAVGVGCDASCSVARYRTAWYQVPLGGHIVIHTLVLVFNMRMRVSANYDSMTYDTTKDTRQVCAHFFFAEDESIYSVEACASVIYLNEQHERTHVLQSGKRFLVSQFELKTTIIIRIENLPVDETA